MAYVEIEEMTKRGVPGVWTHGYYDGWAPNYMFYVANGHNSIGRFYETFGGSGADTRRAHRARQPAPPAPGTAPIRRWPRVKWSIRNNINLQQSAHPVRHEQRGHQPQAVPRELLSEEQAQRREGRQGRPRGLGDSGRRSAPRPSAPNSSTCSALQGVEVHRLNAETEIAMSAESKQKYPGRQLRHPHGPALQPHGRHAARHAVLQRRRSRALRRHRLDAGPAAQRENRAHHRRPRF